MFDGGVLCVSQISHNLRSRWLSSHDRRTVGKHTWIVVKPGNGFSAFLLSWKALYSEVYALLCKSYDIRYLSTNQSKRDSRGEREREREREDDCLTLSLCATTLLFNRVSFDCQVQKFHVILSEMVDVLVVDSTTFWFWSSISESRYKSCGFKEIELLQLAQSRVAAQCLPCKLLMNMVC